MSTWKIGLFFTLAFTFFESQAQNLTQERIRKISDRKKSIYIDSGIFHNGSNNHQSELKAVRHNYSQANGYERIVLDFEGKVVPKLYGYLDSKENKIYIDLFKTKINPKIQSYGNSKLVSNFNFFNFKEGTSTVELSFSDNVSVDIFYLENPGRFVIDAKN